MLIQKVNAEVGQMRETLTAHRAKASEELACSDAGRSQNNEFEEDLGDIAERLMLLLENFAACMAAMIEPQEPETDNVVDRVPEN